MPSLTRPRLAAATAVAACAALAVPAVAATPVAPRSVRLPSAVAGWARSARPVGAVPGTETVRFAVALARPGAAGLAAYARSASTPGTADYQHWLTPAQVAERWPVAPGALTAVRTFLTGAGVTVTGTSPARDFVYASAPASVVASAFHTSFARYAVDGLPLRAPTAEPTLPSALDGLVSAVQGLSQDVMRPTRALRDELESHPDSLTPGAVFLNARPCSRYFGEKVATAQPSYLGKKQKVAVCGYQPGQLRSAYRVPQSGKTGSGQTVAIIDAYASPTIESDANTYSTRNGLPTFASGQFSQMNPPGLEATPEDPTGLLLDPQGWAGEETLDVEAVHAMAPKADIVYAGAVTPENPALDAALLQVVQTGSAQIISNSYGGQSDSPDAADKTAFDSITAQAAAQGIGVYFSAGDDGDEKEATGTRTADYPATSDMVTAVGGTTLALGSKGDYVTEAYWGTRKSVQSGSTWDLAHSALNGAGGGGVSTSYAEPAWQKGVVPSSLATYGGVSAGRVVPDISMDADSTTGFLVGQTQEFPDGTAKYSQYRIGGTSLSCPLFAGVMALADQAAGKHHGLVTPTLYGLAKSGKAAKAKALHDPQANKVTGGQSVEANVRPDYTDTADATSKVTYSLRTLGNLGTLHALKGYDDSTGLGTPVVPALLALLK